MRIFRRSFVRATRATLAAAILFLGFGVLHAQDWPTYRHDIARSGITSQELQVPLAQSWVFSPRHGPEPAWDPPKSEPVEGILELPRVHFDDTFQVAVAGDLLYFGSSSEDKVFCIDTATGKVRWTRRFGGPVRLAPTLCNGRAYVGCDDGYAYCLDAATGETVWTFKAAPHDEKLLGSGKMISLWPLRTGVLVDDGIAYFSAGLFPMEGVYFYAVNADDGTLIWKNDTCGETVQSVVSPQGYMLASKTDLFVPFGRISPAAFDRKTGAIRYTSYFGKTVGGTYALLADNRVFTGTREKMAFDEKSRARFAWYPGRQLLVTPTASYMLDGKEMRALDRTRYPKLSLKRTSLVSREARFNGPLHLARKRVNKSKTLIKQNGETITALQKQIDDLTKKGKERDAAGLQAQLDKVRKSLAAEEKALAAASKEMDQLIKQRDTIRKDLKEVDAALASCFAWHMPCDCAESFILAGNVLFAGGENKVAAFDASNGRKIWSANVKGKAKGLAVASGKLFVSTDTGAIYCFAPQGAKQAGKVAEPTNANPYPNDALTSLCRTAADEIVQQTGIKRGFCLVLGCGTGRLAYELAKRTDLRICAVEPDAEKAEAARKALDAAGLFGSRVTVDVYPYDKIPYADYFANLIVSEDALTTGKIPGNAKEAFRMLKPLGGTICIGQPANASGKVPALDEDSLKQWLADAGIQGKVGTDNGTWLTFTRGALPGAGKWTHEYADAANTTCGDDQFVRCPLGLLWFGRPGPTEIVNRHRRPAAPLAMDGRLFIQGEQVIMAYDSYNGVKLWERKISGAKRIGVSSNPSNLALNKNGLFLATQDQCLRLDVATGETKHVYKLPKADGDKSSTWGYVACVGDMLYGSRSLGRDCNTLFAMDIKSGELRWTYTGKRISHPSISIGDGKVFFVDLDLTTEQRQEAIEEKLAQIKTLKGAERIEAERQLKAATVRMVVALDAVTGEKIWARPVDLTGCGSGFHWSALASIYKNNVLVLFGVYSDGHYWREFFAGQFKSRHVVALSAKDGKTLWEKNIGYRVRPLVIGDTFHAEPWAYDLHTGQQKMRIHPITGRKEPWQFSRPGHHCGPPAASPNIMMFRSGTFGYYDLQNDYGTMHFGTQRTSCWINFIPANGLLLFPEGSAGCMCPFPNQCTLVFKHRKVNRAWAQYSAIGALKPVKHWAINLGAPGDRKGDSGPLWLSYPRPRGGYRLVLNFKLDIRGMRGGKYFKRNSDTIKIEGTDTPWVFASGFLGLSRCVVPLLSEEDGDTLYTVRLFFAELDNAKPGQRVFDIKLQDKVVCKDFDIVKEAGGANRAVVKEFKGIRATKDLKLEFLSKVKQPEKSQLPLLQAIEIEKEKALGVGCAVPSFLLNNAEPEQSGEVRLANNTEKDFEGTLHVTAPAGFTVTPATAEIKLASGDRTTLTLKAVLAKRMPRGTYDVAVKLVRRDGKTECERRMEIEHLADRGRRILKVVEDASVGKSSPGLNRGTGTTLNVDGGNTRMEDASHHIAYLKFRLDVPGKLVSATLRLYNAGNPSYDSGVIRLVTTPWTEGKVTYANRPKLGKVLAKIGRVSENQVVELPLKLDFGGLKELSLAIDPTSCDGINYISREGGQPAELIVEYEP
ncbi:MAG: PQQ-binding-like beta-propeller repeat protein [Planctomycetes bacterium]|nr:PQQ-binding-like beta-propeller repeat protein [Planctomycetota bacterium]